MNVIDLLVNLQNLEGKKYDTQKRRNEVLSKLKDLEFQLVQLSDKKESIVKELHKLETEQKDYELLIETKKEKHKTTKDLLYSGRVTSAKEIVNLEHELELLKKHISEYEDKELQVMEDYEVKGKKLVDLDKEINIVRDKIQSCKESLPELNPEDDIQIEALKPQIPHDLFEEFYRLFRTRNGVAVAVLVEGVYCGGCGLAVPERYQKIAKQGELVRCESCQRILYHSS